MEKRTISLDEVLTASWKRMVELLFRPFDFQYWLIIGFCAWMTILIYDLGSIQQRLFESLMRNQVQIESFSRAVENIFRGSDGTFWERLWQELGPFTGVICFAIGIYVAYLILCLVVEWIRCRFEFVLLSNLLRGTREIRKPWREFGRIGNSYFWGNFLFGCMEYVVIIAGMAILAPQFIAWTKELMAAGTFIMPGAGIWIGFGVMIFVLMAVEYYKWFFYQLLIPIMYRDKLTFLSGLRIMNRLIWKHFWVCFLYYLVILIVWFGFIIAVLVASVLTCCLFLLLLIYVPYIRTLLILPLWIFFRLLGVRFLAELDPRETEPTPGGESAPGEGEESSSSELLPEP